eukprot:1781710-Rhodomonas_salina.1
MAHTPIEKLAALNGKVTGLPCNLNFSKLTNVPYACCHQAKAKHNYYPDASTTVNKDLLTWDLVDMGKEWTMIGGHRYISIFVVQHSCYVITILHKDSTDFKRILNHAFTKIGYIPKQI